MKTTVVPKGGTGGAFSTATSLLPNDFVQALGTYSPRNVRSLNSFCFLAAFPPLSPLVRSERSGGGGGSPESIQMVQPLAIPSPRAMRRWPAKIPKHAENGKTMAKRLLTADNRVLQSSTAWAPLYSLEPNVIHSTLLVFVPVILAHLICAVSSLHRVHATSVRRSSCQTSHCHGDVEYLLLCLVLLFLLSSHCFHPWNMEWEYVAPRLSVSMFCSGGWAGDSCPRLSNCVLGYRSGIVLVSFFPRDLPEKLSAHRYHYSNLCLKRKWKTKNIDIKYNKYIYTYCILHVTSIHETIHDNLRHGSHIYDIGIVFSCGPYRSWRFGYTSWYMMSTYVIPPIA